MRYASLCSGLEAATVAWHPLGWQPVFFSEIDRAASRVLAHHYPSVPNYGDMTKFREWPHHGIDVCIAGTPCQEFSIGHAINTGRAGEGFDGSRSGLAYAFADVLDRYQPRWFIWENVKNVLAARYARGFARFVERLAHGGYGCAWCVIDNRVFGPADQPRPRLYMVGYRGDLSPARAVLFEQEGPLGNCQTKEEAAPVLTARGGMALDDRTPCVLDGGRPRIATPLEWERAMGFPDNYTLLEGSRRPQADGPRYKQLGNSMSVPVVQWLGRRIDEVSRRIDAELEANAIRGRAA